MRNWNHHKMMLRKHLRICFQTTYEELKHEQLFKISLIGMAFRLPMRNWNLHERRDGDNRTRLSDYLWGIETSTFGDDTYRKFTAFRLPMRNWNSNCMSSLRVLTRLSDYLWGIETRRPRKCLSGSSRFQTTYEELKLDNVFNERFLCKRAFRLPMRNWN